jgi:Pvc16 N-terminal domain/Carboxypeptidase regulatory-like domain
MAPTTIVPLNTMLADLDESLRTLLKRELAQHGFNGVEVAFDAPAREWSASVSSPTVNLFLYDLTEAVEYRPIEWEPSDRNGGAIEVRPPLRIDASFSASAWTRAVEDEHRLLSQVLAILYAYPTLPEDVLAGALADPASQRYPIRTRVAQARQDGNADFWNAVGGQYKASVDYVVTLSCEAGTMLERGPEVGTQTVRVRKGDTAAMLEETHRIRGNVRSASGEPVGDAWVVLGDARWAATNAEGRFRFDRVAPGTYRCFARAPDGSETEAEVEVPGGVLELTVGRRSRARRQNAR